MIYNKFFKVIVINIIVVFTMIFFVSNTCFAKDKLIILNTVNIKHSGQIEINKVYYMPVKPIFEAFEWQVHWDKSSRKVICSNEEDKIEFIKNAREIIINGEFAFMDSPFIIRNNIAYVPQKFVVQQFGVKVRWNKKDNLVILSSNCTQSISIKGSSNIAIVGEGLIVNIFEPCSLDTINDMMAIADKLLIFSPSDAIKKYNEILENFSPEDMPDLYARIMNNMGNAYSTIAEYKDTRNNIHKAINSYNEALEYYKKNGDNTDCFTLMVNLGNAYRVLSDVENDSNSTENSILQYNEALEHYTDDIFTLDYALIQYNLGLSYNQLGDTESAASCWKMAQDIYQKNDTYSLEDDPQTYALIKYNLGNIYRLLFCVNNFDDFGKSKQSYEESLKVWSAESFPIYNAKVNTCLGMLNSKLYAANKDSGSLKNASLRFKESLKFFTLERYPVNFAKNNLELGNLYALAYRSTYNKRYYTEAISCYENSLKVFEPSSYQKYNSSLEEKIDELYVKNPFATIFEHLNELLFK